MASARLARINTVLLVIILLTNGYVILLPALPGIRYRWLTRSSERISQLEVKVSPAAASPALEAPKENRLVVPAMLLDEPIYDGATAATLKKGIWRRPRTGTPDSGGNTVLVAHRLTYDNPTGTFYHLDKVRVGDRIGMWWEEKQYRYTVTEVKTVKATEVSIESPTDRARLTLYTCTPLWLPKDRLVVIAEPEDSSQ